MSRPVIDQSSIDPITLQNNAILRSGITNDNIADGADIDVSKLASGAWTSFAAELTGDGGNPTYSGNGHYTLQGQNTCHCQISFVITAAGGGNYSITLPLSHNSVANACGTGVWYDASTGLYRHIMPLLWTTTTALLFRLIVDFGASTASQLPLNQATSPLAVDDVLTFQLTYETA